MKLIYAVLALLVVAACSQPGGSTPNASLNEDLEQVLALVNAERAKGASCGSTSYPAVPALGNHARLNVAAQKHSEDMAAATTMTHATPQGAVHYSAGTKPSERVSQEGYAWSSVGENIAAGHPSPESVVAAWMKSEGHCENIMRASFTEIGLGLKEGYWTQVFARPL